MSDAPREEQLEFVEFLLGANDNPDGTAPNDAEERRRMEALPANVKALAEKYGLSLNNETNRPAQPAAPTARAAYIRQIAEPTMAERDNQVRTSIHYAKEESPDGTKIQRLQIQLGCLDKLSEVIMDLCKPKWIGKLASKELSVFLKVGRWSKAKIEVRDANKDQASIESKGRTVEDDAVVKSE